ncbi:MAG: type II secretion system protein [Phycisphaerae bacterium]
MIHNRSKRDGFTLIELLVVISIIALLISILLPAMVGARRTGQRVACMAQMRRLAEGAVQYGHDNNDWIVGSPSGSGAYLLGETSAFGPAVQNWDFMGPLAHMWNSGFSLPAQGDVNGLVQRFNEIRNFKGFLCAANKFLATRFAGPEAGAGWMVSYNTIRYQLYTKATAPSSHSEQLPNDWRPSISRVGNPANKVFCADGSRFATISVAPDYDLRPNAGFGGTFSDAGPYSTFTRSWDRTWAPGNGSHVGVDARFFAYRHATAEPVSGAKADTFKMNLAFYDGHVETQGDLQSSNPHQWLPAGSTLIGGTAWTDTVQRFGLTGDTPIGY